MNKEERLARKKKEDQALNRVLLWFGAAVILEFFLLLYHRFGINFDTRVGLAAGLYRFLQIASGVCLALTATAFIWWVVSRKKKAKSFVPGLLTLVCAGLFVCTFSVWVWPNTGIQFLYVSVPVVAVLALIYYLYQREFFLVALQGGLTLFAMWAYRKAFYRSKWMVYSILVGVVVLVVAIIVCEVLLQRGKGRLGKLRILPKKANYLPLFIAGALALISVILVLVLSLTLDRWAATAAYSFLIGNVAWLFGAAVYYTIRLM